MTPAPSVDVRPTHVIVDLDRLQANYRAIVAHVGRPVMPVLKANAYGHGLSSCARALQGVGATHFAVATMEEGAELRAAGVGGRILVLGGLSASQIPEFLKNGLDLTASSVDKLIAVDSVAKRLGRRATVHLKFDTGMGRIGQHHETAHLLIEAANRAKNVDVGGIYSHLATADEVDASFVQVQVERFAAIADWWSSRGLTVPTRHLANSAGVLRFPETWCDLVRPGLMLYGVAPAAHLPVLPGMRAVLSWWTRVVYFKVGRKGAGVSYGHTWAPAQDTRLVTIPVGYGDGYMRRMSGRSHVVIRGQRRPVVGTVCMDMAVVDLGPDGEAYNGDPVLLLGDVAAGRVEASELAEWAGTIPWEVLTAIHARVPRVFRGGLSPG